MPKISFIVPAYMEKDNIIPIITSLANQILSFDHDNHEILVIDDKSRQVLYRLISKAKLPSSRLILGKEDWDLANWIKISPKPSATTILVELHP